MSLFDSISIGKVQFKNRLLTSISVYNSAKSKGNLSKSIIENIIKLADMGVGTIILDSVYIHHQGKSCPQQLGIEEESLMSYKKLTKYTKNYGVVLGIRLTHCGAKTNEKICGEQPISSSSSNPNFGKEFDSPRSFDKNDIEELLLHFKHSAELAEEAGFEIIEINGSRRELLDQCFHPKFNFRKDNYGGALKNRLRLSRKIIKEIKKRTKDSLISYYFPVYERQDQLYSPQVLKEIYKTLEAEKIDIFHPINVQILNPMFKSSKNLLHWTEKMTSKKIIADGNIKTFNTLGAVESMNIASLVNISGDIYNIQNWYATLQKRLCKTNS